MSVCLSVRPRGYLPNHTRDLYYFCSLPITVDRSSSGWLTKSQREGAILGFPHWLCIVQHSTWNSYKNSWTDRDAVWDDEWTWPEEQCVSWGDDPRRRGNVWEKHVPDKPNIPNNWELDLSMQRNTTGSDAWLQALDESIIGREVGDILPLFWIKNMFFF